MRARLLLSQEIKGACCSWFKAATAAGRRSLQTRGLWWWGMDPRYCCFSSHFVGHGGRALRCCARFGTAPNYCPTCGLAIRCESALGGDLHDLLSLLYANSSCCTQERAFARKSTTLCEQQMAGAACNPTDLPAVRSYTLHPLKSRMFVNPAARRRALRPAARGRLMTAWCMAPMRRGAYSPQRGLQLSSQQPLFVGTLKWYALLHASQYAGPNKHITPASVSHCNFIYKLRAIE